MSKQHRVELETLPEKCLPANCDPAPRGGLCFRLDLPGRRDLLRTLLKFFLKFLCFCIVSLEPFIFVTCSASAIFSLVPKTLQLPQVKAKELRSAVNKDSSQHFFFLFQVFFGINFTGLEPRALSRSRREGPVSFVARGLPTSSGHPGRVLFFFSTYFHILVLKYKQ